MEYKGNPVSQGIATGEVYLFEPFVPKIEENYITSEEVDVKVQQYIDTRDKAKAELETLQEELRKKNSDKVGIISAHIDMLYDVAMNGEIEKHIRNNLLSPEYAIEKTYGKFARLLSRSKDKQIQERVADLKDIKLRLLRIWFNEPERSLASLEKDVIIVAHDLFPSDTVNLDRSKVLAIITEVGGNTSHTAIIARSYEIPAVLGVVEIMGHLSNDEVVIVDAVDGVIYTEPNEEMHELYMHKREVYLQNANEIKKYIDVEPIMQDGIKIDVNLNIGDATPEELAGSQYTDGVGLFRTEFLYMSKPYLPTEEEQFMAYRKVALEFGERPVIIRTLDVGGDKQLDSIEIPKEDNPFLGLRALRLCFANPEIFQTQLRAILRAACYGNLQIMLPMVGSLDDIYAAKEVISNVKEDLGREGVEFKADVPIGIMIEIPSIALMSDKVAKAVDFASIGTNDLCQYLTATDRLNPAVSKYYQSFHPAMFRIIGRVATEFTNAGKPLSVCGEMGGDIVAASVLIGLGVKKLSMSLASVAGIKKLITSLTFEKAKELAEYALSCDTSDDVEAYIKQNI